MILKKPYAFFIKYFRVIHFIMAIMMGLLIAQTNNFLNFFNEYMSSNTIVIGRDLVTEVFLNFTYLYIAVVLIIDMIIWIVLDFKGKKRLFYIINFFGYILLLIFYIYARTILISMSEQIIDSRLIMVVRDLTIIAFSYQIFSLFIVVIRTLGINLKQFDFVSDLKELDILESDYEEFEVNLQVDSGKIKRSFRATLRNFKYYLRENVRIIMPIMIIIIGIVSYFVYKNINGNTIVYQEGTIFNIPNYSIKVVDTLVTNKDYKLNKIEDKKTLVVVKLNIKTTNNTSQFNFGKFFLKIGDNKYYHNIEYSSDVKDIGDTYIKQKLTKNFKEFLLVFDIPSSLANDEKELIYGNDLPNNFFSQNTLTKIPLQSKFLDQEKETVVQLKEKITTSNSVINDFSFQLNDVSIQKNFKLNYEFCIKEKDCFSFYEIVQADYYGSYDKALLKIELSLSDESAYSNNPFNFITTHGILKYKINNKEKSFVLQKQKIPTKVKSDAYYLEIPQEVLESNSVELIFNTRQNIYKYIINN